MRANLNALAELLSRGVVITAELIQETVDEMVRGGHMTRQAAQRLADQLIDAGLRQTEPLRSEFQRFMTGGRLRGSTVGGAPGPESTTEAEAPGMRAAAGDTTATKPAARGTSTPTPTPAGAAAATRTSGTESRTTTPRSQPGGSVASTELPIEDYEGLTAAQVQSRLGDLSPAQLRVLRDHEKRNANRKTVLAAIERRLS